MKDLLSKEHYPYKIHTLLMKSNAYTPPPLFFFKKSRFIIFSKIPSPCINKERVYTMVKQVWGEYFLQFRVSG